LITNLSFLARVLEHPEFRAGNTHTHFIEEHLAEPRTSAEPRALALSAIGATLAAFSENRAGRRVLPHLPAGFRNNRFAPEWVEYKTGQQVLRVEYVARPADRFEFTIGGESSRVTLLEHKRPVVFFEDDRGIVHAVRVVRVGSHHYTHRLGSSQLLVELPRFPEPELATAPGACVAPMPGKVVKVLVAESDHVRAGDTLVVLEAMKMEHAVKATEAGVVSELCVSVGEQVEADAPLVVVTAD
jgi:acetyl/propionyl-CoA carboxylase alpha subunit